MAYLIFTGGVTTFKCVTEVSQISSTAGGAAELLTDNGGKICRWEHHMGKEPFMLETKELIL